VYDPESRRIFIRRDVIFDESLNNYNDCCEIKENEAIDDSSKTQNSEEEEEDASLAEKSNKRK